MSLAEEFRNWARAPERSDDELYLAELIVEAAQAVDDQKNKIWRRDYEAVREKRKRRRLNPAYRPKLTRAQLDLVVQWWGEIGTIENGNSYDEDRPVRDLSALRFFPHVAALQLVSTLRDLTPLTVALKLKKLQLHDETLADTGPLARFAELEEISLRLDEPWPSLAGLAAVPKLKNFTFHGNLLALAEVKELPLVERLWLYAGHSANTPLRDARDLPAMPRLNWLQVRGIAALRGLERFPALNHLELHGPFVDLAPLASLGDVRKLTLGGEQFLDVHPVAQMPRLRTLDLSRFRGLDVSPLAESPRLREIKADLTEAIKTELASVNAAIGFVDESEFVAEPPPAKSPPRFLAVDRTRADYQGLAHRKTRYEPRAPVFDDDPVIGPAEERWFARQIKQRLDRVLRAGWGKLNAFQPGSAILTLRRYEDITHLREIVDATHAAIRAARFPWGVMLDIQPHGDMDEDLDEIEERHGGRTEEQEAEDEREELEDQRQRWREHKEFLEREHRHRLRQQEGLPIKPEEFAPPPPKPPAGAEDADLATEDDDNEQAPRGLGKDFYLRLDLDRDVVWAALADSERASYYLAERFEDWHALPEPPEQRPLPE